jgi:hypothetical protein
MSVEERNARIVTMKPDGSREWRVFDTSGQLLETDSSFGPEPIKGQVKIVPRDSVMWRKALAPLALVAGAGAAAFLFLQSRKPRGRPI